MYLHRGIKPRVQWVLIDTSTQGHTTWSTGGGLIDVPTQGHTTWIQGVLIDTSTQGHTAWSTGGAHRCTYTGAHNPEYRGCS